MFKWMREGSAAPKPKYKAKKKSKQSTDDDSFHHEQLDKTQICKLSDVVFDEEFWVYGEVTHTGPTDNHDMYASQADSKFSTMFSQFHARTPE